MMGDHDWACGSQLFDYSADHGMGMRLSVIQWQPSLAQWRKHVASLWIARKQHHHHRQQAVMGQQDAPDRQPDAAPPERVAPAAPAAKNRRRKSKKSQDDRLLDEAIQQAHHERVELVDKSFEWLRRRGHEFQAFLRMKLREQLLSRR